MKKDFEKVVKAKVRELMEQEKRRNRVVIGHSTEEDDSDELVKSKTEGLAKEFGLPPDSLGVMIRLKDNQFVSMEVKNLNYRRLLVDRARSLKDSPTYSRVFIKHELKFKQRQESKAISDELQQLINSAEKNLQIVRSQIVQVLEPQNGEILPNK